MDHQNQASYVLGHSAEEFERLAKQARLYEPLTKHIFCEAGLTSGMRVLDIGSGFGDVAFLAAQQVGPTGAVVGTDKEPAAIRAARARAANLGMTNVRFIEGDGASLQAEEPFDAIVGRLVLMYLADPSSVLRHLLGQLRPGGIVAFLEPDLPALDPLTDTPLYRQCLQWLAAVFEHAATNMRMGRELHATYLAAGLPAPTMRLLANMGGGPDFPGYAVIADTVRSALPMIEQLGVATATEVEIETLEGRLRAATCAGGGVIAMLPLVAAWCRKS
jgi:ubiquinone/menaquinone biosynthesis C-methylase UbiE